MRYPVSSDCIHGAGLKMYGCWEGKVKTGKFVEEGIVSLKVNLQLGMLSMPVWENSIY